MAATSRRVRALRGVSAAVIATFFAALSHGVAGSVDISIPAVVGALIVSVFLCVALAGRGLSALRIGLSVLGAQAVFHALFTFLPGGTAAVSTAAGTAEGAAHVHGGPVSITLLEPLTHAGHAGPIMWGAHALAAVVTWLFLLHGEAALHSLLRELRLLARVRVLLGILDERPIRSRPIRVAAALAALRAHHLEIRFTRGPPLAARVSR
ncbi:hypothetical protein [Mycetocola tolaasinivorans]|uniref:hypothetical protein n=1 Tax=Mycetocola tolaasinivorans TaxID=76635 RepID=UPI0016048A50|nr:hypothetical protein [Mycetocola tolaasinivorans]